MSAYKRTDYRQHRATTVRTQRLRPWSRVFGTIYGIKGEHPKKRRTRTVYVGMTAQVPYTKRISQHLYGSHGNPPKPWADTVPGYTEGIKRVVTHGGCFVIWQKRCFYGYLKLRESWAFIWWRPVYNIQENTHRSSHIPKWKAEEQRAERDARRKQLKLVGVEQPHRILTFLNPKVEWRARRNHNGELRPVQCDTEWRKVS